jgi:hypothetical protein
MASWRGLRRLCCEAVANPKRGGQPKKFGEPHCPYRRMDRQSPAGRIDLGVSSWLIQQRMWPMPSGGFHDSSSRTGRL